MCRPPTSRRPRRRCGWCGLRPGLTPTTPTTATTDDYDDSDAPTRPGGLGRGRALRPTQPQPAEGVRPGAGEALVRRRLGDGSTDQGQDGVAHALREPFRPFRHQLGERAVPTDDVEAERLRRGEDDRRDVDVQDPGDDRQRLRVREPPLRDPGAELLPATACEGLVGDALEVAVGPSAIPHASADELVEGRRGAAVPARVILGHCSRSPRSHHDERPRAPNPRRATRKAPLLRLLWLSLRHHCT